MNRQDLTPYPDTETQQWLLLSEAAQLLGVHFTTLRRWANTGKIPHIRTPGGQRRFALEDLQVFLAHPQPTVTPAAAEHPKNIDNDHIRTQIGVQARQSDWSHNFGEIQQLRFRYSGQLLLGLLKQYNSRTDGADSYLQEAQRIAREYGETFIQADLSIMQAIQAFLSIRQPIMDMIFTTSIFNNVEDQEAERLYHSTNDFLDAFLLALVEAYD